MVDMTARDDVYAEDLETGHVTVAAGASLDALMRRYVPQGWFVPVTPGTRQVTVGGAIAADVHGKNHHVDGSLGLHLTSLTLTTPNGTIDCGPEGPERDLFWATVGGLGLTGIIERATLRLVPIATSSLAVDTERCRDIDELMATMSESDAHFRYSVAWIDCLATGASLGRSVLTRGNHASVDELGPSGSRARRDPLAFRPAVRIGVPAAVPTGLLNRLTVRAFNEAWYRKAPRTARRSLESITSFFHPLDGVRDWNRLYGRRGFLQYQLMVPFGAETDLRHLVESVAASGCASFLTVLKRFGPGNRAPLSFPAAGWTLALDLAVGNPGLGPLLDGLDQVVVSAGGRIYLAKDSRLQPELLAAMYPRLDEWRQVRDRVDPDHLMQSDLSRRLGL